MSEISLLDGSIGQELVKRSGDRATPLWSTQVMIDHPDLVRDVHQDYFAVGATIATTNTYAVLEDRLAKVGLADEAERLTRVAVDMARDARDTHGGGRVAGSLGPLIASYRPDICPPPHEAERAYAKPVAWMKDRVDLLLIETMSSVDQAEGALRAALGQPLPVWLAVSVKDDDGTRLRSGEALSDLAPMLELHRPDAVLINCSPPEVISDSLDIVKTFGLPFGAYANGFPEISEGFLAEFPTVDALDQRDDLGPKLYADMAMGWVAQGATIVGGCCEIGPAHIAELATRLRADGHDLV